MRDADVGRCNAHSRVRALSRRFLVVVGLAAASWAIGTGAAQAAESDTLEQVTQPVTDVLDVADSGSASEENSHHEADTTETATVAQNSGDATGSPDAPTQPGSQGLEQASPPSADVVTADGVEPLGTASSTIDDAASHIADSANVAGHADVADGIGSVGTTDAGATDTDTSGRNTAEGAESAESADGALDADGTAEPDGTATVTGLPLVGGVAESATRSLRAENRPADVPAGLDEILSGVVTHRSQDSGSTGVLTEAATAVESVGGSTSLTSPVLRTVSGVLTRVTGTLRDTAETLESSEVLRPVTTIGTGLVEVVRGTAGGGTSRILDAVDSGIRQGINLPAGLVPTGQLPHVDIIEAPTASTAPTADQDTAEDTEQGKDATHAGAAPLDFTPPVLWSDAHQQFENAPLGGGTDPTERGPQSGAAQGSGSAVTSAGSSPVAAAGFLVSRAALAADAGRRLPVTNGAAPVVAGATDDPSFSPD